MELQYYKFFTIKFFEDNNKDKWIQKIHNDNMSFEIFEDLSKNNQQEFLNDLSNVFKKYKSLKLSVVYRYHISLEKLSLSDPRLNMIFISISTPLSILKLEFSIRPENLSRILDIMTDNVKLDLEGIEKFKSITESFNKVYSKLPDVRLLMEVND